MKTALVTFSTALTTQHGGLNSFNFDLTEALQATVDADTIVIPVVTSSEPIRPLSPTTEGAVFRSSESDFAELSARVVANAVDEIIWIGHDVHTGNHALAALEHFRRGRMGLFLHSDPLSYDAYKPRGASTDTIEKRRAFELVANRAEVIFAVGPKLLSVAEEIVSQQQIVAKVTEVTPGLADIEPTVAPRQFRAFFAGRLSAGTAPLKRLDLVLSSFATCIREGRLGPDPALSLFGLDESQINETRRILEREARKQVNVITVPFTIDRSLMFDSLRKSTVALMPSSHEGFGLSAWEAIAAEVPVILTTNSGVFDVLQRLGGQATGCVRAIDCSGLPGKGRSAEIRHAVDQFIAIRNNTLGAKKDAHKLRELLDEAQFTWRAVAQRVLGAFSLSSLTVAEQGRLAKKRAGEVSSERNSRQVGQLTRRGNARIVAASSSPSWKTAVEKRDWLAAADLLELDGLTGDARIAHYLALKTASSSSPLPLLDFEGRRLGVSRAQLVNTITSGDSQAASTKFALFLESHDSEYLSGLTAGRLQANIVGLRMGGVVPRGFDVLSPVVDPIGHHQPFSFRLKAARLAFASAIQDVLREIGSIRRRVSNVEAPEEYTSAVIGVLAGLCHRRVGTTQAEQVLARAGRALSLEDPVHSFIARLPRMESGPSWWLPSSVVLDELKLIDTFPRYKAGRLVDRNFVVMPLSERDSMTEYFCETQGVPRKEHPVVQAAVQLVGMARDTGRVSDELVDRLFLLLSERQSRTLGWNQSVRAADIAMRLLLTAGLAAKRAVLGGVVRTLLDGAATGLGDVMSDSPSFVFPSSRPGRLVEFRFAMSAASTLWTDASRKRAVEFLVSEFETAADSYNTNTHYSLTAVEHVSLIFKVMLDGWLAGLATTRIGD